MSVAASLPPTARKSLAIEVLAKTEPISHLAAQHQVSRKFLYKQGQKANEALDASFSSTIDEPEVLFYLPITKTWRLAVNSGINPHLPLFLSRRGGTITGFV